VDLTKPNQNITFKVGATNSELQRAIEAALPAAMAQTKDLAKRFKGSTEKESCQKIFSFLMSDITYKVDGDNQKIKLHLFQLISSSYKYCLFIHYYKLFKYLFTYSLFLSLFTIFCRSNNTYLLHRNGSDRYR
jgi:hypothetical protein